MTEWHPVGSDGARAGWQIRRTFPRRAAVRKNSAADDMAAPSIC